MNLRLPLPLRRALLAAMCVLGSQTFAAEYTASTLEEFQTAWNQMADGDTLTITGSIDFEGVELGSLPADASIVLKSDGKGNISNFNYKDMSAVNMQHLNVSGRGTVHVGNMTEGMLSGWDEEGKHPFHRKRFHAGRNLACAGKQQAGGRRRSRSQTE